MKYIYQQKQAEKGFTLVELAIVMTIIGLLIGGILKGQELMQNARVTATIAQVKAIEAATTTFRDAYNALPGDLAGADTRLPGCGAGCNPAAATAGNGLVGPTWAWGTAQTVDLTGTTANTVERAETSLFFIHLLMGNLIGGVTNIGVTQATTVAQQGWGVAHPAARVGGGFIVGQAPNIAIPGNPGVSAGLSLALVQTTGDIITNESTTVTKPLTATQAAQMDRKTDDGRPAAGFVQVFGLPASCAADSAGGAATVANATYQENVTTRDCGLLFRIQG